MLSGDLAVLYRVKHKALMQAVKRNLPRFPTDFMFQLSIQELRDLKSQIVTSSWGGVRKLPFVFTQEGIAMLSSVLHSDRAIHVNIQIMKTFIKIREMAVTYRDLREKIDAMEEKYDAQFQVVFANLREILKVPRIKKVAGFVGDKKI